MGFKIGFVSEPYLKSTEIENIFINEYLPGAPGDYVKVFIYSLMYAQQGKELSNAQIAEECGIDEEDVLKAWKYWENTGAIKKIYRDENDNFDFDVEFVSLRSLLYGKKKHSSEITGTVLEDKKVKKMYDEISRLIKRPLGGTEPIEIMSWIAEMGSSVELVLYAYSYCVKTKAIDNVAYVGKILKAWSEKGLKTINDVEKYLEETDRRHYLYRRVMKALGFSRNATEAEKTIIDRWFEEYGFSEEKVLEACSKTSGIPNPNINYVNKVIENRKNEEEGKEESKNRDSSVKLKRGMSGIALTNSYLEFLRKKAETVAEAHREEVFSKLPRIKEIEDKLLSLSLSVSRTMVSGNADKQREIKRLRSESENLTKEKETLLINAGFEKDYLEKKYKCPICKDTGKTDEGQRCICLNARMDEALEWQKTN